METLYIHPKEPMYTKNVYIYEYFLYTPQRACVYTQIGSTNGTKKSLIYFKKALSRALTFSCAHSLARLYTLTRMDYFRVCDTRVKHLEREHKRAEIYICQNTCTTRCI